MKYLLSLLLLVSVTANAGINLTCTVKNKDREDPTAAKKNSEIGFVVHTIASCVDHDQRPFNLEMDSYGLALYQSVADGFYFYCPSADEVQGTYYGISAKAAAYGGGGLGEFSTLSGRACSILRGTAGSLGATVGGAVITITADNTRNFPGN